VNLSGLDGLIWLAVCLVPFLFIQRWLHHQMQAVFLLLMRRANLALIIFSILFLPGVFLHELSHYLMARLLGVKTGKFSLVPQVTSDGHLQLGFVETARADFFRDALIGLAPLLTGGVTIALIGVYRLGFVNLFNLAAQTHWFDFYQALMHLPAQPDFWMWFYLAFAVSSTMLPSASDRQAWFPLILVLIILLGIAVLAGAGPWMLANLAPGFNSALRAISVVFGISLILHLFLIIPFWGLHRLLTHMTGLEVS
jgi:hypothetical protein